MRNRLTGLCLVLSLAACGGSDVKGDSQTPPTSGRSDIEAWLTAGSYKAWKGETAVHAARSPSPHGQNRIYSNSLLSANASGEYPVGSATVKELYDDAGKQIVGYAVMLHTKAGKAGDSWYFYERVPQSSAAPHDANGVVADGNGDQGASMTICVGCHSAAGSDSQHSGHDFIYTQVR